MIELDGHSIINGTNGAGKTTTLKLLAFFYGADPSHLDTLTTKRKPFSQFYLPRKGSLLIFEYKRESGLFCVVVYLHKNSTKHVYRFLEGGYTPERFSYNDNGVPKYILGQDLKAHWQKLGLSCSQQIEKVTDYRAILQNDKTLINRLSDSKALRRLAPIYCLGGRTTHMRHIERICASILNRSLNMERMKGMLADIMKEDGISFPSTPIHRGDASIAQEITSLREFEQEIPLLRKLLKQHHDRMALDTELHAYAGMMLGVEGELKEKITQSEKAIETIISQLNVIQVQYDSQYQTLSDESIEAKSHVTHCKNVLEDLDSQQQDYESQCIEKKKADYENLNIFIESMQGVERRFDKLNEDVKSEENVLNRDLNDEAERYEASRHKIQCNLDKVREELRNSNTEFNEKNQVNKQREQRAKDKAHEEASPERETLRDRKALALARSENTGRTKEESLVLKDIEGHLNMLTQRVIKLKDENESTKNSLNNTTEQRNEDQDALTKAIRHTTTVSDELDALHKITFASDGTWLKKLREKNPNWVSQLGKVVNPELLQMKDLEAKYSDDDVDSIFGWSLNLNSVDTPLYAESEEQLIHEYGLKEEFLKKTNDQVDHCKKVCEKSNTQHKNALKAYEESKRVLTQAVTQKDDTQRHYLDESNRIDQAISSRKLEEKAKATKVDKQIKDFEAKLEDQIEGITTLYHDERSQMRETWDIEKNKLDDKVERYVSDLEQAFENHKSKKAQIREDYVKACSDKGIDTDTIEQARKKLQEAKQKVSEVTNYATIISTYDEWLKIKWSKREDISASLSKHKKACNDTINKIDALKQQHSHTKSDLTFEKTKEERSQRDHNESLEYIKSLKPRLSYALVSDNPTPCTMPLNLLLEETESMLERRSKLKSTLISGIHLVNSKIDRFGETQISTAWQRAKEDLRRELNYDDIYDENFLLNLPQALEIFINEEVDSIKSARIESLRAIGKGLTDFFEKLSTVDKRIKHHSKRITKVISENMNIDALSTLELILNSKVEELDYWPTLHRFSESWEQWRETGQNTLPDSNFLIEMSNLINALQSIKSGNHLHDYFDLHISMVENSNYHLIKNDKELEASTSNGLKYLALCMIFIGISRLLCPDKKVKLHWPIDELGILSAKNITRLFNMLDSGGIVMVGGFPSEDPDLLRLFTHRQVIDINKGIRVIKIPESTLKDKLKKIKLDKGTA